MKEIELEKYILQKRQAGFKVLDGITNMGNKYPFMDFNYLACVLSKNFNEKGKIDKIKLHLKIEGRKALINLFAKNESI